MPPARVAINGLGRIGRAALKIIQEQPDLELVAVNDLTAPDGLAYLLKYDTVYGRYEKEVRQEAGQLVVGGHAIRALQERAPEKLPWGDLGVELVFECTGVFTARSDLEKHLQAGARRVILSAPGKGEELVTVVHGVNQAEDAQIVSCASCTTNCITPVIEVFGRRIGLHKAIMTTIHAYTASQALVDGPASKWRSGRAAAVNFVPASTGAAQATTKALPQYQGKFDGVAIRGPVAVGSLADITILAARATSVEEINQIFQEEAESERYRGVLGVVSDPIVSSDIIKDPHGSLFDLTMTQVVDGDLVKVMSWYDNEWGYASQMVREGAQLLKR